MGQGLSDAALITAPLPAAKLDWLTSWLTAITDTIRHHGLKGQDYTYT